MSKKTDPNPISQGFLDPGFCAFCGYGGGHLGEQGDETSQMLHSSVRKGKPGNYTYETYPGAQPANSICWCGECVGGLKHKYQRYDDTNLRAHFLSSKLRLELDGLRWVGWDADSEERKSVNKYLDDPAIHMDKLCIERDLKDMQMEQFRRYGHDLTQPPHNWRP